jgi:hypothetical protein
MRIMVAALIALWVIVGLVTPASPLDPRTSSKQQEPNLE